MGERKVIRSLIAGGALSVILWLIVLDSSSFLGWESDSLQETLIRYSFVFENVSQSPFVDFLDFSSVSFSAVVPDLVAIIKIRQYKCAIL